MSDLRRLSNIAILFLSAGLLLGPRLALASGETRELEVNRSGLYRDVFDQNIYDEGTNYLHLERLYRGVLGQKAPSADINIFDEVPDSAYFVNRHSRKPLSETELERGYRENEGPDLNGELSVIDGEVHGIYPAFLARDAKGKQYVLKFDSQENFELSTSAEVIADRFYYAIGYNVPQCTVESFDPKKIVAAPNAEIYDDTGFRKKLTPEKLAEHLILVPQDSKGFYRASVCKTPDGEEKGVFAFQGRRKGDPSDLTLREKRREIRALRVFSSWLNNYDVRSDNTMEVLVQEGAQKTLKHYLSDFNASLGSGGVGVKPPMVSFEHLFDYGETAKAILGLGFWEKPWQKRWREAGEKVTQSPAVGYFDNTYFDPGSFKIELPHYAFKDLTNADGFWAAKIIMSFSDKDIRAMVNAGKLSSQADTDYLVKTLAERRDIVGRYWFSKTNPLDRFALQGDTLRFKDLAVEYGFEGREGNVYSADLFIQDGKKSRKITSLESKEPLFQLGNFLAEHGKVDARIRTKRAHSSEQSPYVLIELNAKGIAGILHQD